MSVYLLKSLTYLHKDTQKALLGSSSFLMHYLVQNWPRDDLELNQFQNKISASGIYFRTSSDVCHNWNAWVAFRSTNAYITIIQCTFIISFCFLWETDQGNIKISTVFAGRNSIKFVSETDIQTNTKHLLKLGICDKTFVWDKTLLFSENVGEFQGPLDNRCEVIYVQ